MKKILLFAAQRIDDIDTYAVKMLLLAMVMTDILLAAGCVYLLFPTLSGSAYDAYYTADQLCGTALRAVVLGCIFAMTADILFRRKE